MQRHEQARTLQPQKQISLTSCYAKYKDSEPT
jgi:hypothetical protein